MDHSRALAVMLLCAGAAWGSCASAANAFARTQVIPSEPGSNYYGLSLAYDGVTVAANSGGPSSGGTTEVSFYANVGGIWVLQGRFPRPLPTVTTVTTVVPVAVNGTFAVAGVPDQGVETRTQQGIVRTFSRASGIWVEAAPLQAQDGARGDMFGARTELRGSTLAVSAVGDDTSTLGDFIASNGAVYIYVNSSGTWQPQAKISLQPGGSRFGAILALGDDVLAVAQTDAIYVYHRSGTAWALAQTLRTHPDGLAGPPVGTLAIEGNRLAVDLEQGSAVLMFSRVGDTWVREPQVAIPLRASDEALMSGFAFDGSVLVKLARTAEPRAVAYVYRQRDGAWFYDQRIAFQGSDIFFQADVAPAVRNGLAVFGDPYKRPTGTCTERCGELYVYEDLPLGDNVFLGESIRNVAGASGDGAGDAIAFAQGLLIVGAPDADAAGSQAGEAYVFAVDPTISATAAGRARAKSVTFLATLRSSGNIGDKFGNAVAVTDDGSTIAIGSPLAGAGQGSVAVFKRPPGGWASTSVPDATIGAPPATPSVTPEGFGSALAFNKFGVLTVGAPLSDRPGAPDAGMAAAFVPKAGTYPPVPDQTFVTPVADTAANFGDEVSADGAVIAISASNEDKVGPLPDVGAVYTFASDAPGGTYSPAEVLAPPDGGGIGDKFGRGLAVRAVGGPSPTIVVGAPGIDNGTEQDTGRAIVYEDPGDGFIPVARLLTGGRPFDRAASSIAIHDEYVVIGAPEADRGDEVDSGTAFLFRKPPGGWLAASAALAKSQGKQGYAVVDLPPEEELPAASVQESQFFGAALSASAQAAYVSAPARDVQLANGAVSENQGEIDVFIFDDLFASGFE